MDKRKALGRGLGALIPNIAPTGGSLAARVDSEGEAAVHQRPATALTATTATTGAMTGATTAADGMPPVRTVRREFFLCPIEEIAPSRDNPRQRFDEQRLGELADSIKAQGLVQPLVVRLRSPEEVAALVCFLLGPDAGAITGQQIFVCAGASL